MNRAPRPFDEWPSKSVFGEQNRHATRFGLDEFVKLERAVHHECRGSGIFIGSGHPRCYCLKKHHSANYILAHAQFVISFAFFSSAFFTTKLKYRDMKSFYTCHPVLQYILLNCCCQVNSDWYYPCDKI